MDPLARMQLHSDSFRAMTEQVQQAADRLCGGKLVMVHEGGYAESYVPFCGLAVMEALSGIRTEVQDPLLEFIQQQQPRRSLRSSSGRPRSAGAAVWPAIKRLSFPAVMAGKSMLSLLRFHRASTDLPPD
jgi:hypothetical protein